MWNRGRLLQPSLSILAFSSRHNIHSSRILRAVGAEGPKYTLTSQSNGDQVSNSAQGSPKNLKVNHNDTESQAHTHTHTQPLDALTHIQTHSHGHSHAIEPELLDTRKLGNPAVRITLLGLFANIGMAVGKGIGGVVFHSHSLVADAVHAFSDLISDALTLSTVSISKKKPSVIFPNGYGRIETVGAFGVSAMLVVAGASMAFTSLNEISASLGYTVPFLSSVHAGHSHHVPAEWSAAVIALISIGVKEALYQATIRVAKRENSPVLYANAWHHRLDCLVSVVAVVSITLGQVFQAAWLDPLGALFVSVLIIRAGWSPTYEAAQELCGSARPAIESETFQIFKDTAKAELELIAPNYEIVRCSLEPYGSTYVGSVQLKGIDENAEKVAAELKQTLMKIPHMRQVYVRI